MAQIRAEHSDLEQSLRSFLQSSDIASRTKHAALQGKLRAAPIASGLRATALYCDAMLCVDDAAAPLHPISAEGIPGVLTSGRLAAETALVALKAKDYTHRSCSLWSCSARTLSSPGSLSW